MAKKHEAPGIDTLMKKVDEAGGFTLQEKDVYTRGVYIPTYGERYLRDSNVYLLARMEMYVGEPSSGKTSYMLHEGIQYLKAGGYFIYIETENKFSETFLRANMGEWASNPRFRVLPVVNMTIPKKKKGEKLTEEEEEASTQAWMDQALGIIQMAKAVGKDGPPIYLGIDSLLGSASPELREQAESGGGMANSQSVGPRRAQIISNWYRVASPSLAHTNLTIGVTNHLGKRISMDGKPIYGSDIAIPGGNAPKFYSNLIMLFFRGTPEETASTEGRDVRIRVDKNSSGAEGRDLRLSFVTELAKDEAGETIMDDNYDSYRIVRWKWEESTAKILCRFFDKGIEARQVLGSAEYRRELSVEQSGTQHNYRYSVPAWGLDKVTDVELNHFVENNVEPKKHLQKKSLTSITTHRGIICRPEASEAMINDPSLPPTITEKAPRKKKDAE